MTRDLVSISWPSVPGADLYDLDTDGQKSSTRKTTAKFGVGDGSKVKISVRQPTPPPNIIDLPTREHHLVGSASVACREDYASPITGTRTRWWEFDPGYTNAPAWVQSVGTLPREVWILSEFAILPGGYAGRIIDAHAEVSDSDIQDHAKIPGAGVSSFAIDHNTANDKGGSYDGIMLSLEPEGQDHGNAYHWPIIPTNALVRGKRYRLKIHLGIGRRGTSSPGYVQVWALDFDQTKPAVDLTDVSTVWGNQSVVHFLQGPYNPGATAAAQMAANRFGRTEAEAHADAPVYTGAVAGRGPSDYSIPVTPGWQGS